MYVLNSSVHGSFQHLRKAEMSAFVEQLETLLRKTETDPAPVYFILEAEPGMGRSTASEEYKQLARAKNLKCNHIRLIRGDEAIPYGVFGKVLIELIGTDEFSSEDQQRHMLKTLISRYVAEDAQDMTHGHLKLMLGLIWIGDISPKANAVQGKIQMMKPIQDIMNALLTKERCCMIIDDAHYCDELSWNELEAMMMGAQNVAFLITLHSRSWSSYTCERRSFDAPRSQLSPGATFDADSDIKEQQIATDAYSRLLSGPRCKHLDLRALPSSLFDDFLESISPGLPQFVKNSVFSVSAGVPYWIGFISNMIIDYGSDVFMNILATTNKPDLNAILEYRLQHMGADQKLNDDATNILLLASIIGDDFSIDLLKSLVVDEAHVDNLPTYIELLKLKGFIRDLPSKNEKAYEFQHPFIRRTVYEVIPTNEASVCHQKIAVYIEKKYPDFKLRPYYSRYFPS
jgi:hypothetical protein